MSFVVTPDIYKIMPKYKASNYLFISNALSFYMDKKRTRSKYIRSGTFELTWASFKHYALIKKITFFSSQYMYAVDATKYGTFYFYKLAVIFRLFSPRNFL